VWSRDPRVARDLGRGMSETRLGLLDEKRNPLTDSPKLSHSIRKALTSVQIASLGGAHSHAAHTSYMRGAGDVKRHAGACFGKARVRRASTEYTNMASLGICLSPPLGACLVTWVSPARDVVLVEVSPVLALGRGVLPLSITSSSSPGSVSKPLDDTWNPHLTTRCSCTRT
jgi:hypothetical protein